MRRLRLCLNLVILLTPLLVLGIATSRMVRRLWTYLNGGARLAAIVSTEASKALGRNVRIGNITFRTGPWNLLPNRVELDAISVASGPGERQPLFGQADRVVVWYSLNQILFANARSVPYVSQIQLIRPAVWLARDVHGRWNFSQLVHPSAAPGRPIVDKLLMADGSVYYYDQDFPHPLGVPPRPLATQIDHLTGVFLMRPDKSVAYNATGQGDQQFLGGFRSTGIVSIQPTHIGMSLAANRLNLPNLGARLLTPKQGRILTGSADVDIALSYVPNITTTSRAFDLKAVGIHGGVVLHALSLTSSALAAPVTDLNGSFTIVPEAVMGAWSGKLAGADFNLNGRLIGLTKLLPAPNPQPPTPNPQFPYLSLQGTLRHFNYQRMAHAVRMASLLPPPPRLSDWDRHNILTASARGDFDFQVAGPLNNPVATTSGHLDFAHYERYRADDMKVQAFYADRVIDVETHAKYARGDAVARGHISFEPAGPFEAEVHGRNVQLADLSYLAGRKLAGQGKVDFSIRGRRGHTPYITAQAEVNNAAVDTMTVSSVYANAVTLGRKLVIKNLRVEDDKGFALASGSIDIQHQLYDINLEADELDIGPIVRLVRQQLEPASYGPPHPLALKTSNKTSSSPSPLLPFSPSQQGGVLLNLDSLQGVGYVRAHIGGTYRQPVVQGRVSAFSLQAGKVGLDRVLADVTVTRHSVKFVNGTAERYPGELTFSGQLTGLPSSDPGIALTARAQDFDVSDLLTLAGITPESEAANPEASSLLVTGRLQSTNIAVGGTLYNPRLEQPVTFSLTRGSVNGLPIQAAIATASYDKQGVRLDNARMDAAGGNLTASGFISKDGRLDIDVTGNHLNLTTLLGAVPKASDFPLSAGISFQGHVTGTTQNLAATAQLRASDVDYKDFRLGDVEGNLGYADKRLTLAGFTLTDPTARPGQPSEISINDLSYDLTSKQIHGTARWDEVPIQRLTELFARSPFAQSENGKKSLDLIHGFTQPIQGAISGTAALSGTATEPTADITWNAQNIQVQRQRIDRLTGSALIDPKHVVVPSPSTPNLVARLESPDATVVASHVDMAFGGNIDADVSANHVNLAFLQHWLPDGAANPIAGTGTLYFTVHGTTASPVVQASASLRNVAYGDQKIDAIDVSNAVIAEPRIQSDLILFSKSYKRADGSVGRFEGQARGSIAFSWQSPFIPKNAAVDLAAAIPEQELQALTAFSPGMTLDTDGKFSVSVQVANTLDDPRVTGSLNVQAGHFRFGSARTGLQNLSGRINFTGSQLEVAPGFTANTYVYGNGVPDKQRKGTPIIITGSLPLTDTSSAAGTTGITIRDDTLFVYENPLPVLGAGSVRGDVSLNLLVTGSAMSPMINGDITLFDMAFSPPFSIQAGTGPGRGLPINPGFNLIVHVGRNVRATNPEFNARVDGDVSVKGKLFEPLPNEGTLAAVTTPAAGAAPPARQIALRVFGNINVRDGYLQLPTARFTLLPPGSVALTYPAYDPSQPGQPTLGVNLDVRAQSFMDLPTGNTFTGRTRYRVIITARGPISGQTINPTTGGSRLALNIQTDPPAYGVSQQELQQLIASSLGGGPALNQIGRNPGQAVASALTNVFASAVLPSIFQRPAQALGFEELALSYDPVQHLSLVLSRRIFGPLYVTYMQTLGETHVVYDIKVSLRFSERYQLSYEEDEIYEQIYEHKVELEGIWRF